MKNPTKEPHIKPQRRRGSLFDLAPLSHRRDGRDSLPNQLARCWFPHIMQASGMPGTTSFISCRPGQLGASLSSCSAGPSQVPPSALTCKGNSQEPGPLPCFNSYGARPGSTFCHTSCDIFLVSCPHPLAACLPACLTSHRVQPDPAISLSFPCMGLSQILSPALHRTWPGQDQCLPHFKQVESCFAASPILPLLKSPGSQSLCSALPQASWVSALPPYTGLGGIGLRSFVKGSSRTSVGGKAIGSLRGVQVL